MLESIWLLKYHVFAVQSRLLNVVTLPAWRMEGLLPPDDKVPQPVIQHSLPAGVESLGKLAVPTQLVNLNALLTFIKAMSLELPR